MADVIDPLFWNMSDVQVMTLLASINHRINLRREFIQSDRRAKGYSVGEPAEPFSMTADTDSHRPLVGGGLKALSRSSWG
jgi:hypothetical protein